MLLAHVAHSMCRTNLSAFVRYAGFDRLPRNRTFCAIHALNWPRDPCPLWRHGCFMSFLYSEGRAFAAGKEGTSEPGYRSGTRGSQADDPLLHSGSEAARLSGADQEGGGKGRPADYADKLGQTPLSAIRTWCDSWACWVSPGTKRSRRPSRTRSCATMWKLSVTWRA